MARAKGLDQFIASEAAAPVASVAPAPEVPESSSPVLRESVTPDVRSVAKYRRLERLEARLGADQVDELSTLAKSLSRRRPAGVGERITVNTLLRVAVDLLLAHADGLSGTDEDALLRSLGLEAKSR